MGKQSKKKKKFKKYYDDEGRKNVKFEVFIVHASSSKLYKEVQKFIEEELRFKTIILQEKPGGDSILNKLKNSVWWEADCAVVIMSADDMARKANAVKVPYRPRPRQNVVFELGYCQGIFDSYYGDTYDNDAVFIIKDKSIDFEDFSDLKGIEIIEHEGKNISLYLKVSLSDALNNLYKEIKKKSK
jgi:predicted nucleotide-binding protein